MQIVSVFPVDPGSTSQADSTCLIKAVSGLIAAAPAQVPLLGSRSILLHQLALANSRVQLLAALPPVTTPAASTRSELYAASVLQHAALLLLLLVSDSALLVLPADAVPPSLLQLLHTMAAVHQALLQSLSSQAGSSDADDEQGLQEAAGSIAKLLAGKQQPTQLHVALQAPAQQGIDPQAWSSAAAAAVQQAEQTLLKCRAAVLSPALHQQQQGSGARQLSNSGRGHKGRLFELAGVHCCGAGAGPNAAQARRKAVLSMVQQQLLAWDRQASNGPGLPQQQQQQAGRLSAAVAAASAAAVPLPGLDQLLTHIVAATAATAATANPAAAAAAEGHTAWRVSCTTPQQLQHLWHDLLQQLSAPSAICAAAQPQQQQQQGRQHNNCLTQQQAHAVVLASHGITLTPDDVDNIDSGDESSVSEDSWYEEDEGWEEVQQQEEQPQSGQQQQQRQQQQHPWQLLAAAVDPLYLLSAKSCRRAAVAALRVYMQAVPQRYTVAVHQAAVSTALRSYAASASGPAAPDLQQQLVACCQQVWAAGRQQCSKLSLTGRPCVLSPHDATQQPHSSGTQLQVYAPNGSSTALAVPDWIDWAAANITPARQQLQVQQAAHGKLLQLLVRLVPAAAAGRDASQKSTSSIGKAVASTAREALQDRLTKPAAAATAAAVDDNSTSDPAQTSGAGPQQQQQRVLSLPGASIIPHVLLGPWLSMWRLDSGSSAYDPQAGLPGFGWATGFNKLLQLRVLVPVAPTAAQAAPEAAAAGARTGAGPRAAATAAAAAKPGQQRQGPGKQDFASQLKRKGGAGRGAGGAPGSTHPVPEVLLGGPEDFPTLQQAVGSSKKQGRTTAAAPAATASAKQQVGTTGASSSSSSGGQGVVQKALDSTQQAAADAQAATAAEQPQQQQQQQLVTAWAKMSGPHDTNAAAAAAAAGSEYVEHSLSAASAAAAAAAAAATAGLVGRSPAGGRSSSRGGRGGRSAAAGAAAAGPGRGRPEGRDAAGQLPQAPAVTEVAQLWIGLEYCSLSGARLILQPQQLPTLLPHLQPPQQQEPQASSGVSFAAAAAAGGAASAAGGGGGGAQQEREGRHRRGSKQQQQQAYRQGPQQPVPVDRAAPAQQGPSMAQHSTPGAVSGPSVQGAAVSLLQSDIPLFLQPEQLQLPQAASILPQVSSSSTTAASGLPVPLEVLQLQRVYVRTPAKPFALAAMPRVCFRWSGGYQEPNLGHAASAAAAAAADKPGPGPAGVQASPKCDQVLEFRCETAQVLASDSLVVLTLPQVYAAPQEWVQTLAPAAAAAAACAAAQVLDPGGSEPDSATAAAPAADTGAAVARNTVSYSSSSSSSSTAGVAGAGHVARSLADSTAGSSPEASGPQGSAAAAANGVGPIQALLPLIPFKAAGHGMSSRSGAAEAASGWSAWLRAGWLYPVYQLHAGAPSSDT